MGVPSLLPAPASTDSDNSVAGVGGLNLVMDDPNKKVRKPYTITKSRQNWTETEHDKFLEALNLFDRDWKKIEAFVGSKTAIQIRSHAQKYFLKVQKNGTNEHIPPPRPKRKAAHPYPHKAPKTAPPNIEGILRLSAGLIESGDVTERDAYLWPTEPTNSAALSSWKYNTAAPVDAPTQDDMRSSGPAISHNCCSSSIESGPGMWPNGESNNQNKAEQSTAGRVLPNFAEVYRFIGSVFDPSERNHLQKLKKMDPVDVNTAVQLMKNLCANLKSPEFDNYRRLFSSYDPDAGQATSVKPFGNFHVMPGNAIASS